MKNPKLIEWAEEKISAWLLRQRELESAHRQQMLEDELFHEGLLTPQRGNHEQA